MNLVPFRRLLEKKCGLVFHNEKSAILEAGIRSRMDGCAVASDAEYLVQLDGDPREFGRLIELLTINETYFLREPAHFSLLAGRIVPELLAAKEPGSRLKILSAGCSSGEEAYSVVISLAERFGRDFLGRVSVCGGDIDTAVIDAARRGVFGKRSFRDFPEPLLERYFEPCRPGLYRLRDWLRDSVEFLQLNLLESEYPAALRDIDVIFYRNVSIYFSPEVRNEIFSRLAASLNQGGYLVVSPSETFFHNKGILSLVPLEGAFLYRKDSASRGTIGPAPARRISPAKREGAVAPPLCAAPRSPRAVGGREGRVTVAKDEAARPAVTAATSPSFGHALEFARAKDYPAALELLERLATDRSEAARAHTLRGSILLNLSRLDEARKACLAALESDAFSLEATLSLGIIARLQGDGTEALRKFREAVYLRPSCWPAHYYLGEAYLEQGEAGLARREYEVILKLLEKGDFSAHGISFMPLCFSAPQLETLCRQRLLPMKGTSNGH